MEIWKADALPTELLPPGFVPTSASATHMIRGLGPQRVSPPDRRSTAEGDRGVRHLQGSSEALVRAARNHRVTGRSRGRAYTHGGGILPVVPEAPYDHH